MSAPRPVNWEAMWRAHSDNAEFARQCAIYFASLPHDHVDITQPRYSREDVRAFSGD